MSETIHTYATDLQKITIIKKGNNFEIVRSLGHHGQIQLPASQELVECISNIHVADLNWSFARHIDKGARSFRIPGAYSVAFLSLIGVDRSAVQTMIRPFANALQEVSKINIRQQATTPTLLDRILKWIDTGEGPKFSSQLYSELVSYIGNKNLEKLQTLISYYVFSSINDPTCISLSLGSASARDIYPKPGSSAVTVLIDEINIAPVGWDLGCLIGEQLDILFARGHRMNDIDPAVQLLESYIPLEQKGQVEFFAALRWLTHLHDYSAYVSINNEVIDTLHHVCKLLLEPNLVLQFYQS